MQASARLPSIKNITFDKTAKTCIVDDGLYYPGDLHSWPLTHRNPNPNQAPISTNAIILWSCPTISVTDWWTAYQGAVLLSVRWSYVGNDVTHSTLLDRACACSYKNLPKYRSYRVSNTAPWLQPHQMVYFSHNSEKSRPISLRVIYVSLSALTFHTVGHTWLLLREWLIGRETLSLLFRCDSC